MFSFIRFGLFLLFVNEHFNSVLCRLPASSFAGLTVVAPPPVDGVLPPVVQPVTLSAIDVEISVKAWAAEVEAKLHYRNTYRSPIECQFIFPISEDAAVYKLEAIIGNQRLIKGVVKNRTQAEEEYQQAIDAGQTAALLTSQKGSRDIFKLMLGNLDSNEEAVVTIAYAQPMFHNPDTGELTVTLPVVLNPRYTPSYQEADLNRTLTDNFNLQTDYVAVSDVRYTMSFVAKVEMGDNGPQIQSLSSGHASDTLNTFIYENNKKALVTLANTFVQDHDFQLRVKVDDIPGPTVFVEPGFDRNPGEPIGWNNFDVAGAWLEPLPKTLPFASDQYWIVVDRSGSMGGTKIRDARTTLQLILKSLPVNCEFNVIGFGSTFDKVFPSGT